MLKTLAKTEVTPAIHLYYWAEDLSPTCLEEGCNGKSRAEWDRLASELAQHLDKALDGGPVLIILESEFNKGSVSRYEPFDGYLERIVDGLHRDYPNAVVVLGFGNWNPAAWGTWDRAATASDAVGLQALMASPRQSSGEQLAMFDDTVAGLERLRDLFGKPIVLSDVATSSFPEPVNLATQEAALAEFLAGGKTLAGLGVVAVLHRSFADSPGMALAHHFGEAERHWGLAWPNGTLKPAGILLVAASPPASVTGGADASDATARTAAIAVDLGVAKRSTAT